MNTNTYNILEAIGGLDNNILENAFKPKKKKRMAFTVIAAAAALTAILGCASVLRSAVRFDGNEQISLNYYAQKDARFLTYDELVGLGAEKVGTGNNYTIDMLPSELFALYNVKPLLNSEFYDEEQPVTIINSAAAQAVLGYTLTDKNSGKSFSIQAQFGSSDDLSFGLNVIGLNGEAEDTFNHFEFLTLADGSRAFVGDRYLQLISDYSSQAVLCRDGVGFVITAKGVGLEEMKEFVENLGFAAEK